MTHTNQIDVRAFKEFERDSYSAAAAGYDQAAARVTAKANPAILDAIRASNGKLILDVACGPGWLSEAAIARGADVTGIDFAPNMVRLATSRNPSGQFHEGDAEDLPFSDGQFDAVVCSCGILHFPRPERAISEAFRVLGSGGRYAITCWRPPAQGPFFALVLGSIQTHGTMEFDLPAGPPLFRFGEEAECEKVLADAGFVSVSTTEVPVVWDGDTPEGVLEDLLSSTARIASMLGQQTDEQRALIEAAIVEGARGYVVSGRVEIPAPVLLACGEKP